MSASGGLSGATVRPAQEEIDSFVLDVLPPQGRWHEDEYLWLSDHSSQLIESTDSHTDEVTVLVYRDGAYVEHGSFARGAQADSPLLPGLAIDIRTLFAAADA